MGLCFVLVFSPARPRIRYPVPAAARSVLVAMGTRAGASLRKCDAVSRPMGMARPGARRFPTGTPSLARSRGAPRTTSRPWPSHNPARTPGLFLFRHLAAPVSLCSRRLPAASAASRCHPGPAARPARPGGTVRLRPTGPARSEPSACPLALSGASGAEGGGKRPRSPQSCGAGAAEAGPGSARGAERGACGECGSSGGSGSRAGRGGLGGNGPVGGSLAVYAPSGAAGPGSGRSGAAVPGWSCPALGRGRGLGPGVQDLVPRSLFGALCCT